MSSGVFLGGELFLPSLGVLWGPMEEEMPEKQTRVEDQECRTGSLGLCGRRREEAAVQFP